MIIRKIYIREYAGLRDTEISLCDGLNVIRGDNESGKSSVLGFIRFIFYGLPAMKGADNIAERERSLSWTTGSASGYIEIADDGGNYRLERSHQASGVGVGKIIDTDTGAQVFRGEDIWKRFPGVPQSVFDSVCCVKQQKIGALDGEAVKSAIENLLMSGDEAVNTGLALKRLDRVRKELMLKKGQGGIIAELEKRENDLYGRLSAARQNAGQIIALQASVDKYRGIALDCRRELENAGNRLHACESCIKLERFDELHSAENEAAALKKAEEDFIIGNGRGGKLPDGDYLNALSSLSRKLGAADSDYEVAKAHLTEAKAGTHGDTVAAGRSEDIRKAGGADEIIGRYRSMMKKRNNLAVLSAILCVIGLFTAAVPVILTFAIKKYLPVWMSPGVAFAISAVGIIMLAAGITLIPAAVKLRRKAGSYITGFGYEEKTDPKTVTKQFPAFALRCDEAFALNAARQRRISEAEEEIRRSGSELGQVMSRCAECIGEFTDEKIPESVDGLEEFTLKKADEYAQIIAGYTELHGKTVMAEERMRMLKGELADEEEASLRSHLLPEAGGLREIGLKKLSQERDMQAAKLEAVTLKLSECEKNLAVLQHTAENPARLALEYESAQAETLAAKRKYDAVMLAYETIEGVGESLRRNITPRLRQRAGSILSVLTDGKYDEIGIADDFSCTVRTEGGTKSIALLSGGTRDAVYFALRIALLDVIFGESLPPLVLDEVCAQLDDRRMASVVRMLDYFGGNGIQSLLFTCHDREEKVAGSVTVL